MIKICIDPHCDELAHNAHAKDTRCRNCGQKMVTINEHTYLKKFIGYPFQVDYSSQDCAFVTPQQMGYKLPGRQTSIFDKN